MTEDLIQPVPSRLTSPKDWAFFFISVFFFISTLFASFAVMPGYSLATGSSPFQAGLQNMVFSLAAVLFRFKFGPAMDQKGPKRYMLWGLFAFATAPLLMMLSRSYALLLAARIYQSAGLAFFLPGIATMTALLAPRERIGTYLGATRIFLTLGLLAGPSTALILIDRHGYNTWFIISFFLSAASSIFLKSVKTPPANQGLRKYTKSWNQVMEAITNKKIYPIIGGIAIYSISYSAAVSFSALFIETYSPGSETASFFIYFGLSGAVTCLGAGFLSDRLGRVKLAWPLLAITGIGAAALYFLFKTPLLIAICGILLGIGVQGSALVLAAWLIDVTKPALLSTTIGIQENTIEIFFALGALLFGLAAQGRLLGPAFLVTGIVTIALAFYLRGITVDSKQAKN